MSNSQKKPLLFTAIAILVMACGEVAQLKEASGVGTKPQLPPPNPMFIPSVNIAPAIGWSKNGKPLAMPGLSVNALAIGLDHPRWFYVLPNGDVLVAETNAPPRAEDSQGIKGWIMGWVMAKAGECRRAQRNPYYPA